MGGFVCKIKNFTENSSLYINLYQFFLRKEGCQKGNIPSLPYLLTLANILNPVQLSQSRQYNSNIKTNSQFYKINNKYCSTRKIYKQMSIQSIELDAQHFISNNTQPKPKIAFTYQPNRPVTNISNVIPMDIKARHNKNDINVKGKGATHEYSYVTPRRENDKENNCSTGRQENSVYINEYMSQTQRSKLQTKESTLTVQEDHANKHMRKNNSPVLTKYPPVSPKSPKILSKKQNKCPSFLNQKSKVQQQLENQINGLLDNNASEDEYNCKCGKPATHRIKGKNEKCCSKCGISKMIQGMELEPFDAPKSNISIKSARGEKLRVDQITKSEIITKSTLISPVYKTIDQFVKDVSQQKKNIQKYYKEYLQNQGQNINSFYKQRKLQLKSHYEKIKAAIKLSIEEDLKQIQILQKQQLEDWKKSVTNLQEDLKRLQRIENEAKQSQSDRLNSSFIKESTIEEYQEIVARNRSEASARQSKVEEVDTMNVSGISNMSNISSLTAALKNFNANGDAYKSDIYRMVSPSKIKSARPSDLTITIYTPQSQILAKNPRLTSQVEVSSCLPPSNKSQKYVLFSFEGKK